VVRDDGRDDADLIFVLDMERVKERGGEMICCVHLRQSSGNADFCIVRAIVLRSDTR